MKSIAGCLVVFLIVLGAAQAEKDKTYIQKKTASNTNVVIWDGNEILMPVLNDGSFADFYRDNNQNYYHGLSYKNNQLIYSSGFWISAMVNDSARAAISLFGMTDFTRGIINETGSHFVENDSIGFRVYKINKGDNADTNPDYAEWPIEFGAPTDENGNPLIIGDQTIWCSFTDAYFPNRILNPTPSLNAEIQLTVWGWQQLENVVFLRWKIINKSDKIWKDAFVGIFVDPDLEQATDDLVGSDSTLNMAYCYESLKGQFGKSTQSVAYQFIEPPVTISAGDTANTLFGNKINYLNAPVLSPPIFKHFPREWNEYPFSPGSLTRQYVYDRLNCRDENGNPLIDHLTGNLSKWVFSGDPVFQTGWLDSLPHDRRMMISTGPFDVAPGDTNGVTLAIIANINKNRLNSIIELKHEAMLIQQMFDYQLKIIAEANVRVEKSTGETHEVYIQTPIICEKEIDQVFAMFYDFKDTFQQSIELFDDGAHGDEMPDDLIYGNILEMQETSDALFLNLRVLDKSGNEFVLKRMVEGFFLSSKLNLQGKLVADHLNFDGKANPGENIHVTFEVTNHYDFDIEQLIFLPSTSDSLITVKSNDLRLNSLFVGENKAVYYDPQNQKGYFEFTVPSNVGPNHKFLFDIDVYDNQMRHWRDRIELTVDTLIYEMEQFKPTHVSGKSESEFIIGIVNPAELKKHSYEIVVVDSINKNGDKGFDLSDLTAGIVLLKNSPVPDEFAFNIPATDGFKILKAYLPEGGMKNFYFEEISGGNETGFNIENIYDYSLLGEAPFPDYYKTVELEFSNKINSSGVVGEPLGQKAFRFEYPNKNNASGFFACPFYAWKIENSVRSGKLNFCFEEWPIFSSFDDLWGPNTSLVGGFENILIMKNDYDETGNYYLNRQLDFSDVLYKLKFYLVSDSSVVDVGDKLVFEFHCPASSYDRFVFVPTLVEQVPLLKRSGSFVLFPNYPNPFNQSTVIKYSLEKNTKVNLKILNVLGQEIVTLFDGRKSPGNYSITWDGKNETGQLVSSGLYFAILQSPEKIRTTKMLLIR
jgi:hypothetical protein